MKRYRQTTDEILAALSPIESSWRDAHSEAVIRVLDQIPDRESSGPGDIANILDMDFRAGLTVIRLALDMSKDEFEAAMREGLGPGGIGSKRFGTYREAFLSALIGLGADQALTTLRNTPVTWKSLLVERLKSGRGSAIRGQLRGRMLEDFAEEIIQRVFGKRYDARCRFVGAQGVETEKADFAVPSKDDPQILVEVKAYGATGSKQTDVLGDISRIVDRKRHDTHLLLVTDGATWKARQNDLRKLVEMQNRGLITRIYTRAMGESLEEDLRDMKESLGL